MGTVILNLLTKSLRLSSTFPEKSIETECLAERMVVVRDQEHLALIEELSLNIMKRIARTQPVQDHHSRNRLHNRHHHRHERLALEDQPSTMCQRQRRSSTNETLLQLRLRQHWRTDEDQHETRSIQKRPAFTPALYSRQRGLRRMGTRKRSKMSLHQLELLDSLACSDPERRKSKTQWQRELPM